MNDLKKAFQGDSMRGRKTILVVDDEKPIRDILEQIFGRSGYMVRCAASAEEALDILQQENIQVMFLDLNLPGMNGVELCNRIRKNGPIAVIYAITGYPEPFEFADCREVGFDDYFIKPVELKSLVKAAHDAFEKLEGGVIC
jgi:CheY-like chemotaxis protein